MKRLIVLALLVFTFSPASRVLAAGPGPQTATAEKVGLSQARLARIGAVLDADIEKGKLPGAVVLVARNGKIVYFESFGFEDKAAGKRMTKDAIFRVYSMTKPWVSVAAMSLVEEGKMQLTDPVSRYLPAYKNLQVSVRREPAKAADVTLAAMAQPAPELTYAMVPAEREATIQDLLRHTAGLAYDFVTKNAPVKQAYEKAGLKALDPAFFAMTPAAQVEAFASAPLAHQPGTVWEYSYATDVLGRAVEAATGARLSKVLDERLFQPLKMKDSAFWLPKEKLVRVAQPLPIDPATGQPNVVLDPSTEPKNDSGGAGGLSTALDYYRFAQMMLNGGQLDGKRILTRPTVALMTSDHLGTRIQAPFSPGELLMGVPGYTFGLGFMVRQGPGVAGVPGSPGEFMWGGAAGTFFWVDPKENLVAVFMSQAPGPSRAYYRRLIKTLVYQSIVD